MKRFLFLAAIFSSTLSAIDYSPWFERILYFQGRFSAEGQWGDKTELLRNEAALKVTPWTDIRAEIELSGFTSRRYGYSFEAFKASGQYRIMNDIVGDPVTLVAGLTGMIPSSMAKHERALFYPGSEMLEAHLIIGREFECHRNWFDRFWIDLAYGAANERSPWWRSHFQADWNLYQCTSLSLYLSTLAGGGSRALELGGIFYYPVDWGTISLTFMRRPLADRLPRVTGVTLQFETPLAF